MLSPVVYMDNHATTRVDPRVVAAMLPYFTETYGNAGSINHAYGHEALDAVDAARRQIAVAIGASPREIVFTSGATESNNLAIRGTVERHPQASHHLISVATEHRSILDPLEKLSRRGHRVAFLPVTPAGDGRAGLVDPEQVAQAIGDDTILVSVMLANNEIGAISPLAEIAAACRQRGVPLHCDATQAVGKIPVDVETLQVDLMSFSAHKVYGPKGVGALYVRRHPPVRLAPQIDGGAQERGLRSGTLNVPGIVGFARALQLCLDELPCESRRQSALRSRLWQGLTTGLEEVTLHGPSCDIDGLRLPGNLNVGFGGVDGEALMTGLKGLAVSSGSACTTADPAPSHVLRAMGVSDELSRASLRFGLGRFNTSDEVEFAIHAVTKTVSRLRQLTQNR